MSKASDILGLNSRERMYKSLNSERAKEVANSKLLTKEVLAEYNVAVPELYAIFEDMEQVNQFDFSGIKTSFVIKPSGGSGGKGILIIRKPGQKADEWIGIDGRLLKTEDLKLHISDILEGQYSTYSDVLQAFVEERVPLHPKLKKYVHKGTPDLRVIVYNQVPIMAMLRLPSKESEGRANLHQGAIGVGIDIASGITLTGVYKNQVIRFLPGTKRKLNGIKIPRWNSVLKTAVEASKAAKLAYSGVDILLHEEKGPMVVELNASPGLSIQLANQAGLKWRLERVEGLNIRDAEHGVRVGRSLFAEQFADKVKAEEGITVVDTFETIQIRDSQKNYHDVKAILKTGSYRSAIDGELAEYLGLLHPDNILWQQQRGKATNVVIEVMMMLKGKKIKTAMTVVKRKQSVNKVVIGRLDLQGFLINPVLSRSH